MTAKKAAKVKAVAKVKAAKKVAVAKTTAADKKAKAPKNTGTAASQIASGARDADHFVKWGDLASVK